LRKRFRLASAAIGAFMGKSKQTASSRHPRSDGWRFQKVGSFGPRRWRGV